MRAAIAFQVGLVCLLTACTAPVTKSRNETMIVVPIETAEFLPADPASPNGHQIAVLSGDPSSGPSAMLMRFKKGSGAAHVHSADYQLVVLQGTMKHWGNGRTKESARPLGPGSYWFQPGGEAHTDICVTDECLLHIVWSGKRDGRLATESDR
jgi:quercetin dioxygenase-like cupin family protein